MISVYVNNLMFAEALLAEALAMFRDLANQDSEVIPMEVSLLISATADIGTLLCGKHIRSYPIVKGMQ